MKRLTEDERQEFLSLANRLSRPRHEATVDLGRLGELGSKTDTYDRIPLDFHLPPPSIAEKGGVIYAGVWPEAATMRRTGALLPLVKRIKCPVLAAALFEKVLAAFSGDEGRRPSQGKSHTATPPLAALVAALRVPCSPRSPGGAGMVATQP